MPIRTRVCAWSLASIAVALVNLAPADALAISRTIFVETRAVNHTDSDVFVHIQGPYVQDSWRKPGSGSVERVEFEGDRP